MAHSQDDEVVPVANGRLLRDQLAARPLSARVEWHEYETGGHWVNEPEGVEDLIRFIRAQVPK